MLAAAKRFLIYKINSEKIKFDNTNLKFAIDNLKKKKQMTPQVVEQMEFQKSEIPFEGN